MIFLFWSLLILEHFLFRSYFIFITFELGKVFILEHFEAPFILGHFQFGKISFCILQEFQMENGKPEVPSRWKPC